MSRHFNVSRAASALAEASVKTDKEIAAAYGVGIRTVEAWRSRLSWDTELQEAYKTVTASKLSHWTSKIPDCLDRAIDFLMRSAEQGNPCEPDMVKAITGAMAMLHEVQIVQEAIATKKARSVIASRD